LVSAASSAGGSVSLARFEGSARQARGRLVRALEHGPVALGDVAEVIEDAENTRLAAWTDREPAIILNVHRQPGANVIETVDAIKAALPELSRWIPPAIDVAVINDQNPEAEPVLSEEIAEDAFHAMRFLPDVVTSAIESTLARIYDMDPDELAGLLYPED
jgi:multidrug efflux pump subunit AcrB